MPVRHIALTTATGTFPGTNGIDFGNAYRYAAFSANTASTAHTVVGTVEGNIGAANTWQTILTLTTGNSTGQVNSTGSDLTLFDKLRIVLTANNSTASMAAWLAASD